MRYYLNHPNPVFRTDVDRNNWFCAHEAFSSLDEKERLIITVYHLSKCNIEDVLYQIKERHDVSVKDVWGTFAKVEKDIAKARGLL
jgi:hypothetical protein